MEQKLPILIKLADNKLSIVDAELTGKIIATANSPEIAKEIVTRWNVMAATKQLKKK